jgi:hypothetical protein
MGRDVQAEATRLISRPIREFRCVARLRRRRPADYAGFPRRLAVAALLDCSALGDQTVYIFGGGEVDPFWQFLDVESYDSFHVLPFLRLRGFPSVVRMAPRSMVYRMA